MCIILCVFMYVCVSSHDFTISDLSSLLSGSSVEITSPSTNNNGNNHIHNNNRDNSKMLHVINNAIKDMETQNIKFKNKEQLITTLDVTIAQ